MRDLKPTERNPFAWCEEGEGARRRAKAAAGAERVIEGHHLAEDQLDEIRRLGAKSAAAEGGAARSAGALHNAPHGHIDDDGRSAT